MSIPFDHLVLLVTDLDVAVRDFGALGFTVLERADAEHGATRFRFVSFRDGSYILLTAFASAEGRAGHRLGPVLDAGEGWADYSFAVPDMAGTAAALAERRCPTRGPVSVSNVLDYGARWRLELLMTGRGAGGDVALPFVIADVEGRAHRIPGPSEHANGAVSIRGLSVSTEDPRGVADTLAAIGGAKANAERSGLRVSFGKRWVDVLPAEAAPEGRPGGGIVEVWLETEADGPADERLDPALCHGAPIRMTRV